MEYSIIIPHKNSTQLLKRLLESIPNSLDIQTIVVDDNSSKEELARLKSLSITHHFEFYPTEGKTAGGARNTGIKYAKGKWLIFADADDYFELAFKEQLSVYKDSIADIVYFPVTSRYSATGESAYRGNHVNLMHQKFKETGNEDYLRCCHLAPWGKMIKKSLVEINRIRYEECIAGNDNWFSVNTGVMASNIIVADIPIYCITVSSGSLTTTLNIERFEAKLQSSLRTNRFLRQHGKTSFQISILYFLVTSYQFGIGYIFHVIGLCVKMGANPFIGIGKILHPKRALVNRQNKNVVKDERL